MTFPLYEMSYLLQETCLIKFHRHFLTNIVQEIELFAVETEMYKLWLREIYKLEGIFIVNRKGDL